MLTLPNLSGDVLLLPKPSCLSSFCEGMRAPKNAPGLWFGKKETWLFLPSNLPFYLWFHLNLYLLCIIRKWTKQHAHAMHMYNTIYAAHVSSSCTARSLSSPRQPRGLVLQSSHALDLGVPNVHSMSCMTTSWIMRTKIQPPAAVLIVFSLSREQEILTKTKQCV